MDSIDQGMGPKGQPIKLLSKPRIKWIMERLANAGTSLKEEGRATLKTAAREMRAKARLRLVSDLIKGEDATVSVLREKYRGRADWE